MEDTIVRQLDEEPRLKHVVSALTELMGEVGGNVPFSIDGLGECDVESVQANKNDLGEYEVYIVVNESD